MSVRRPYDRKSFPDREASNRQTLSAADVTANDMEKNSQNLFNPSLMLPIPGLNMLTLVILEER
jgi:hypothetical protein